MTKKTAGILSLSLFTIVALLHILHEYFTPVSGTVLMWSRWIFIASLFIWGWFKKSLTTWIMIAMAMGIEIGVDFPAFFSLQPAFHLAFCPTARSGNRVWPMLYLTS